MTTSVRIINEGPLDVTLKIRQDGDVVHEVVIEPQKVSSPVCMYHGRQVEVIETQPKQGA